MSQKTDSSLVSNENLSKILLSSGWTLGQVTWPHLSYDITLKKAET